LRLSLARKICAFAGQKCSRKSDVWMKKWMGQNANHQKQRIVRKPQWAWLLGKSGNTLLVHSVTELRRKERPTTRKPRLRPDLEYSQQNQTKIQWDSGKPQGECETPYTVTLDGATSGLKRVLVIGIVVVIRSWINLLLFSLIMR